MMQRHASGVLLLATTLVLLAPLVGIATAGEPFAEYLRFPPRTEPIVHAPFAWRAFMTMCVPGLAGFALCFAAIARARPKPAARHSPKRFPW